jgi:ATP synthase protein I
VAATESSEIPLTTGFGPDGYSYETAGQQDATANYPFGYQPDPFPVTPPPEYVSETKEETARRSSMAFSAGIAFFGAVVFMLFLGWIADWLIGSSPWGLVGGIVLGSVIGLIQFVRISGRIFNSDKSQLQMRPLMQHDDEKQPPDGGF